MALTKLDVSIPFFPPRVEPKQNVILQPESKYAVENGQSIYYVVDYVMTLPDIKKDFGAITAGNEVTDQLVTEIYMNPGWLAQYRYYPLDDIQVLQKQPLALTMHTIKNTTAYITKEIVERDPCLHLTQFYQWQDTETKFTSKNVTAYNVAKSRLRFFGFGFKLTKMVGTPDKAAYIPVEVVQ